MKVSPMSVKLVDSMGTDLSVVNSARVSFDKQSEWDGFETIPDDFSDFTTRGLLANKDVKLISYLAKHNHFTPFTHATATFRIKVPIFVARQLHKHQVGFTVNEVSRRYVDSEPEFFFPDVWRKKAENVKQGSSEQEVRREILFHDNEESYKENSATQYALNQYNWMLLNGVCAEQARMYLPLNTHTEFWMTGSLYGWARLVKLRSDPHAQKEIQDVAHMIHLEMRELFPVSWSALLNG